jgi:fructose 1,6-bisphosphate aldolase/phosphatase
MDVDCCEGDRVIELVTPEETYDLAALLRDNGRFVVEAIHSRHDGDIAVSSCTTRLRNIAGKYVGKDDPIMLVRTQKSFPATGEVLAPFEIAHYVAGFMRGSHTGPLMPVTARTPVSFFDGPPMVRTKASEKAHAIRQQGFSGSAMLGYHDLEYVGIKHRLDALDARFTLREEGETNGTSRPA